MTALVAALAALAILLFALGVGLRSSPLVVAGIILLIALAAPIYHLTLGGTL